MESNTNANEEAVGTSGEVERHEDSPASSNAQRNESELAERDDADAAARPSEQRSAIAPEAASEEGEGSGDSDAEQVTVADEPPLASLPFGSWDGPELELEDATKKRSDTPSLAPTPSLMPAVRAAKKSRNRAALVFFCVVILLAGGAYALTFVGPEEAPQSGEGLVRLAINSNGALVVESAGALESGSDRRADGSSDGAEGSGRASGSGALDDSLQDSLGVSGEHGGQQQVGAGHVGASSDRMIRGQDGELAERRDLRGRSGRSGRPLSGEQVMSTVGANARSIRSCHEREMRRTGMPIQGRLVVRIVVGGSGVVRDARVVNGPSVGGLTACIERAVSSWRFPEASAQTVVETPFVLASR